MKLYFKHFRSCNEDVIYLFKKCSKHISSKTTKSFEKNNFNSKFDTKSNYGLLTIYANFKKKSINWWLANACFSENIEIVNLMIEKSANYWNLGLTSACEGGHIKIVNLMIEKGANNWNWGLNYACKGGNIKKM